MSTSATTGTLRHHQNRRRRGRKRRFPLKPGPYHDLSSAELQVKTISLLKNTKVGQMTAGEAHECGKLIISWSRRASPSSSSSIPIQTNHDTEQIDKSLSGKMAERLLRRLVKEKDVGNELAKPSANLYNLVSITHLCITFSNITSFSYWQNIHSDISAPTSMIWWTTYSRYWKGHECMDEMWW